MSVYFMWVVCKAFVFAFVAVRSIFGLLLERPWTTAEIGLMSCSGTEIHVHFYEVSFDCEFLLHRC